MEIKQIKTGKWKENCYVINNSQNEAIIIDPGAEADKIEQYIDVKNLIAIAIFNTHAHYDHIGAVKYLKNKYKVPFFLHSKDEKLLKSANLYQKIFDGVSAISIPKIDYYLDECDPKKIIKNFEIKIISTPGHTQGSVCIFISNYLFTGDTLMNGEIGRTDLPGGSKKVLIESLKKISVLPKDINIYPGHGIPTNIDFELKNNQKLIKVLK